MKPVDIEIKTMSAMSRMLDQLEASTASRVLVWLNCKANDKARSEMLKMVESKMDQKYGLNSSASVCAQTNKPEDIG